LPLDVARAGLEKLAGQDATIGPPFRYATITAKGLAMV
jgi:hypothetical protein